MATTVSAPLFDLNLEEQSLLVANTGDVNAIITRIVIHFSQEVPAVEQKIDLVPPLLNRLPQGVGA